MAAVFHSRNPLLVFVSVVSLLILLALLFALWNSRAKTQPVFPSTSPLAVEMGRRPGNAAPSFSPPMNPTGTIMVTSTIQRSYVGPPPSRPPPPPPGLSPRDGPPPHWDPPIGPPPSYMPNKEGQGTITRPVSVNYGYAV
uniref:Uncharacterized protein n=1 Tax=Mycena chlorophos TaxID=658473 RepID=A0ABQ0L7X5_MYCCL|nr:predicted protein [Mycena chlorophos]